MIKWIMLNDGLADNLGRQVEKVFKHSRQGSYATRKRYYATVRKFVVFIGQNYRLQKIQNISDKHLEAYIRHLKSEGSSDKYCKTELSGIRYFVAMVPNGKHILSDSKNQNRKLDLASTPDGRAIRRWTDKEFIDFLDFAKKDNQIEIANLLQICYSFGLRLEEAITLRRNQLENAIRIGQLNINNTKGGMPRTIPVKECDKDILNSVIKNINRGDYILIPREYTDKIYQWKNYVEKYIYNHRSQIQSSNRTLSAHNVKDGDFAALTLHGLRHSCLSRVFLENLSEMSENSAMHITSEYAGHHRPEVTKIYTSGLNQFDLKETENEK
jgi:integrase/recombinase XerD